MLFPLYVSSLLQFFFILYKLCIPSSMTKNPMDIYNVTQEDVQYAYNHPFRKVYINLHVALRVPPLSLADEINLTNLVDHKIQQ